jgi:hypothetical protein
MNLLVEYCRRKGIDYVPTHDNGVCFFNKEHKPTYICTLSMIPKANHTCLKCLTDNDIIVEVFSGTMTRPSDVFSSNGECYNLDSHEHLSINADVLKYLKSKLENVQPVYMKNAKDIERWMWQFFLANCNTSKAFKKWIEQHETTQEPLRTHEQMFRCASRHPGAFSLYYSLYQGFVGRRYLLLG